MTTPEDKERLSLATGYDRVQAELAGVGIYLGTWAGRGAWATMSVDRRHRAGREALRELTVGIGRFAELCGKLAEMLALPADTLVVLTDGLDDPDPLIGTVCTPTAKEIAAWAPHELDYAVVVQWPGGRERRWEYLDDITILEGNSTS